MLDSLVDATADDRRYVHLNCGVPAVVRWPAHVDDQHIDMRRTQPVDSLPGKGMLMDVAANDEYCLLGSKRRQR